MNDLNQYGDKFQPTEEGRGVDISSQRADELDEASLDFITSLAAIGQDVHAVDLGGGFGAHSVRMAQAGARVTMVDLQDTAAAAFAQSGFSDRLRFVQKDFAALTRADIPESFDILYSQRAIHYLPYEAAIDVLGLMRGSMKKGGRIYVSAAGRDTEYGLTHPDRDRPVGERFDYVSAEMQKKHGIAHKITIYSQDEFAALLERAGFSDIQLWCSGFGNIKAVAEKR